jgi:hypothetical protein
MFRGESAGIGIVVEEVNLRIFYWKPIVYLRKQKSPKEGLYNCLKEKFT